MTAREAVQAIIEDILDKSEQAKKKAMHYLELGHDTSMNIWSGAHSALQGYKEFLEDQLAAGAFD